MKLKLTKEQAQYLISEQLPIRDEYDLYVKDCLVRHTKPVSLAQYEKIMIKIRNTARKVLH